MKHKDLLYGYWELPPYIQKLIATKEMIRLRNITQSVMPNSLIACGTIPSRFHHGLGACYLAIEVIKKNPCLKDYAIALPVAALLHDAGNPPFTHMSESFLKQITGKNGESFLEDILDGSETARVIKDLGLSIETILSLVTGNQKPIAEILHGSMDIDNLDNVARFYVAAHLGEDKRFDPLRLARAFRFTNAGWQLPRRALQESSRWQDARAVTYNAIYSSPHLNVSQMLRRGVEFAYLEGELTRDFFFLDDFQALEYLRVKCNPLTRAIIERTVRWDWYHEAVSFEWIEPSSRLLELIDDVHGHSILAHAICSQFGIGSEVLCVYIGKGRDRRRIAVPFVDREGRELFDARDDRPLYRAKVFIAPEVLRNKKAQDIRQFVLGYLAVS